MTDPSEAKQPWFPPYKLQKRTLIVTANGAMAYASVLLVAARYAVVILHGETAQNTGGYTMPSLCTVSSLIVPLSRHCKTENNSKLAGSTPQSSDTKLSHP